MLIVIGIQMLVWIFFISGLVHLIRNEEYALIIGLLVPALYVLALSSGPEGAPRFRAQYQPFLLIIAAIGLLNLPMRAFFRNAAFQAPPE